MSEFEEKAGVTTEKVEDSAEDVNLVQLITSGANARGIPSAVFIVCILFMLLLCICYYYFVDMLFNDCMLLNQIGKCRCIFAGAFHRVNAWCFK